MALRPRIPFWLIYVLVMLASGAVFVYLGYITGSHQ